MRLAAPGEQEWSPTESTSNGPAQGLARSRCSANVCMDE